MAIQVVRARERGPSTAAQFAQAFGESAGKIGSALAGRYKKEESDKLLKEKEEKENEFFKRILNEDVSGANPKQKEILLAERLKGEKGVKEEKENVKSLKGALSSIQEMRNIRNTGNLGLFSGPLSYLPGGGDVREARGKYQTLGNSLIQFASSIPIRNKQEFEKLAGHIGDPSVTDAESKGILDALEKIIMDSMSQYYGDSGNEIDLGSISLPTESNAKRSRPPLTEFMRS